MRNLKKKVVVFATAASLAVVSMTGCASFENADTVATVGGGMTVRMAWEKIVVDYRVRQKSGSKKRYAYEFMSEGLNMLKSGKPQIYVYEEFGMKCGIKEYMKFSSLIVQNIKKGTKELALLLTLEAKDAFEERKNMAKKYGEEAGTKLLLPMIIMLIVVMAIIMVPALMSFSGY